jgi:hypothetical protein
MKNTMDFMKLIKEETLAAAKGGLDVMKLHFAFLLW